MPTQLTLDDVLSGEINNERMREILRLLNEYEAKDGPNVFEDIVYGFPEYDRSATDGTYAEDEYCFVLSDGTRVERSQDPTVPNGLIWTAYRIGPNSDKGSTWQMDDSGRAFGRDGKEEK